MENKKLCRILIFSFVILAEVYCRKLHSRRDFGYYEIEVKNVQSAKYQVCPPCTLFDCSKLDVRTEWLDSACGQNKLENDAPGYPLSSVSAELELPAAPDYNSDYGNEELKFEKKDKTKSVQKLKSDGKCWIDLGVKNFFQKIDNLDQKYEEVRKSYQNAVGMDQFDKKMLKAILEDQGRAARALHNAGGDPRAIPAGLNLGGYCMAKVNDSILFFHRLKLRNSTRFRINYLHNDLMDMTLTVRLALNDLHLVGNYERMTTRASNPSELIYKPTFGVVELLLKDAGYKMEGRYRMLKDRLLVELITSEIIATNILITYRNNATDQKTAKLDRKAIDSYLQRMRSDLDKWLKDYFNDYLTLFELAGAKSKAKFLNYDKQKAMMLNDYVDRSLDLLKYRLRQLRAVSLKVPDYEIYVHSGMYIKLHSGVLRGVDSMHRRSVATTKKVNLIRNVNAVIGFAKLKLEYSYHVRITESEVPLAGKLVLTADELTAMFSLSMVKDPDTFDLTVEFMDQIKPEALTVEGGLNKKIANIKHLIEHQILSIMSNTLIFHVEMLSRLSKCGDDNEPVLPGHTDPGELFSEEEIPTNRPPPSDDDEYRPKTTPSNNKSDEDEAPDSDERDKNKPDDGGTDQDNRPDDRPDDGGSDRDNRPDDGGSDRDNRPDDGGSDRDNRPDEGDSDHENRPDDRPDDKPDEDNTDNENKNKDIPKPPNDSTDRDQNNKPDDDKSDNEKPRDEKESYGVDRVDSVELVLPASGKGPGKKMHIKYKEQFSLDEVKP